MTLDDEPTPYLNKYNLKDLKEIMPKGFSSTHGFDSGFGEVDPRAHKPTGWVAEPRVSTNWLSHSRMPGKEIREPAGIMNLKAGLSDSVQPFGIDDDRFPNADAELRPDKLIPKNPQGEETSLYNIFNRYPYFQQIPRVMDSRAVRLNPDWGMNIADIVNFNPTTSQIEQVRAAAMRCLDDPAYLEAEAKAVAKQTRLGVYNRTITQVARDWYDNFAADGLADRISSWGASLIRSALSENIFEIRDLRVAVKERVDRVDLCASQVRQTLDAAKVREAYVDRVAQRADQILGGKY